MSIWEEVVNCHFKKKCHNAQKSHLRKCDLFSSLLLLERNTTRTCSWHVPWVSLRKVLEFWKSSEHKRSCSRNVIMVWMSCDLWEQVSSDCLELTMTAVWVLRISTLHILLKSRPVTETERESDTTEREGEREQEKEWERGQESDNHSFVSLSLNDPSN